MSLRSGEPNLLFGGGAHPGRDPGQVLQGVTEGEHCQKDDRNDAQHSYGHLNVLHLEKGTERADLSDASSLGTDEGRVAKDEAGIVKCEM